MNKSTRYTSAKARSAFGWNKHLRKWMKRLTWKSERKNNKLALRKGCE